MRLEHPPKDFSSAPWPICGAVFSRQCQRAQRRKPEPAVARGKPGKPEAREAAAAAADPADRALLLADAERLEDFDHARRVRAALRGAPGRHFEGRAILAAVSGDLAEQSDARHPRSGRAGRAADLGLRIRRHSAISRPQDRPILSARRARTRRRRRVAVLADGRARADGGTGQSLPALRAGEDRLRGSTATPTRSIGCSAS